MMEINFMWQASRTWYFFLETCFLGNMPLHISSQGFDLLTNNFCFGLLFFPTSALDCYCEGTSVQCNSSSISYGNYSDPHLHVYTSCLYGQRTIISFSSCKKALSEGTGNDSSLFGHS